MADTISQNKQKNTEAFAFNNEVYSESAIRAYEFAFGRTYVSTGGAQINEGLVNGLKLSSGDHVLDIGCGLGGSAFYMAKHTGAHVTAVDFASNMIKLAEEYLAEEEESVRTKVVFERNDILECNFQPQQFDLVYSRDTFLHIHRKDTLFKKVFDWLKPGGSFVFTDISEGTTEKHGSMYGEYVTRYDLSLLPKAAVVSLLEQSGFIEVAGQDLTDKCLEVLHVELNRVTSQREEFLKICDEEKYEYIVWFWNSKMERFGQRETSWCFFKATKPK